MFFITICAVLATTLDLLQWDENKIDTAASCLGQAAHVAAIFQLSFYVLTEIECIHDWTYIQNARSGVRLFYFLPAKQNGFLRWHLCCIFHIFLKVMLWGMNLFVKGTWGMKLAVKIIAWDLKHYKLNRLSALAEPSTGTDEIRSWMMDRARELFDIAGEPCCRGSETSRMFCASEFSRRPCHWKFFQILNRKIFYQKTQPFRRLCWSQSIVYCLETRQISHQDFKRFRL